MNLIHYSLYYIILLTTFTDCILLTPH